MTEVQALFGVLRQTVQPEIVDALEQLVNEAPDRRLARVNALAFAAREGLDEEQAIAGSLHASPLGRFELPWTVLCPGSGVGLVAHPPVRRMRPTRDTPPP